MMDDDNLDPEYRNKGYAITQIQTITNKNGCFYGHEHANTYIYYSNAGRRAQDVINEKWNG